jgi:N-acetylglucosamine kinase-like BadF-type ATPase
MLFLGVDGGATKTAALLVNDRGEVLGWGIGGSSNYHHVGLEGALASVSQAVDAALADRAPHSACFCLASADMPHDFAQLNAKLSELHLDCPFTIRNDVIGIFRAGSRFPYGVGVVCGTGYNAGGISRAGEEFRFPSLGRVTGDCACGGDIAMEAIGKAFRAWDGRGQPTMLADAILRALNAPDFETLAERWVRHELTQQHVNSLTPLVFDVSEAGDPVARDIIRGQGVELGVGARAILRRLDLTEVDCDVVLGGSVFYGKGDLLMNSLKEVVGAAAPQAVVKRLDVPPVAGAVLLAADSLGATISRDTLRSTLPKELQVPSTF